MFLNNLFHFLKGYVIITITGSKTERFLCMSAKSGLKMWDIKRTELNTLMLSMSFSDFARIRPIARKCRLHVRIVKKSGLPVILKKYRRRYFLGIGAVLFALCVLTFSQFIWTVEIHGVKNADASVIAQTLHDMGVYEGAPRHRIGKTADIKNALLNRVDNITWAWVYFKGTKAICEIYEDSIPPRMVEGGGDCNIIAARDGIIKRIIATDGIKQVQVGDTVCAGDLLISGMLYRSTGEFGAAVEAGGVIEAKTWHEKKGQFKLYNETKRPTGRKNSFYSLKLFSWELPLYISGKTDFEDYVTEEESCELKLSGEHYLGIALEKRHIYEVRVERQQISYDMAVYAAKCRLEEEIAHELLAGSEKVSENLVHSQLDDETVEVTLTMEFTELIGVKAPIEITEEKQE